MADQASNNLARGEPAQSRDSRLELAHIEEHTRRLREQLRELEAAEETLAKQQFRNPKLDQLRAEAGRIAALAAAAEADVANARSAAQSRQPSYAVVPYDGPDQTLRRPMYIECTADRIILQPENIEITAEDFLGPLGPGNPLAAGLRAARKYLARSQGTSQGEAGEPYPLLLVRPDGVDAFYQAKEAMSSWGSEFGYELIDQDWKLEFRQPQPAMVEAMRLAIDEARIRQHALARAAPRAFPQKPREWYRVSSSGGVVHDSGSVDDESSGGGGYGRNGRSGRGGSRAYGGGGRSGWSDGGSGYAGGSGGVAGRGRGGAGGSSATGDPADAGDNPYLAVANASGTGTGTGGAPGMPPGGAGVPGMGGAGAAPGLGGGLPGGGLAPGVGGTGVARDWAPELGPGMGCLPAERTSRSVRRLELGRGAVAATAMAPETALAMAKAARRCLALRTSQAPEATALRKPRGGHFCQASAAGGRRAQAQHSNRAPVAVCSQASALLLAVDRSRTGWAIPTSPSPAIQQHRGDTAHRIREPSSAPIHKLARLPARGATVQHQELSVPREGKAETLRRAHQAAQRQDWPRIVLAEMAPGVDTAVNLAVDPAANRVDKGRASQAGTASNRRASRLVGQPAERRQGQRLLRAGDPPAHWPTQQPSPKEVPLKRRATHQADLHSAQAADPVSRASPAVP